MNARPGRTNILRGVLLLCRGKAAGLAEIGSGPDAFLSSLAPMVAFPLVGCGLMASQGRLVDGATDFLASLVAILAPPVLSHALATRYGHVAGWYRFATAFNWCQWVLPVLGAILVLVAGALVQAGLPLKAAIILLGSVLLAYAFWLHWFLARHALGFGRGRALLFILLVNLGTLALVGGPQVAQMLTHPSTTTATAG
ncbi:hypothetical protein [Acidisoma sp. 7E03]